MKTWHMATHTNNTNQPTNNSFDAASLPAPLDVDDLGDSTVADMAVVLRPRYHFAARPGVFYQVSE